MIDFRIFSNFISWCVVSALAFLFSRFDHGIVINFHITFIFYWSMNVWNDFQLGKSVLHVTLLDKMRKDDGYLCIYDPSRVAPSPRAFKTFRKKLYLLLLLNFEMTIVLHWLFIGTHKAIYMMFWILYVVFKTTLARLSNNVVAQIFYQLLMFSFSNTFTWNHSTS